jgi:hypothetical protein
MVNMQPTKLLLFIAILAALTPAVVTLCILIFWHPNRVKLPRILRAFPVIMPNGQSLPVSPSDPHATASNPPPR